MTNKTQQTGFQFTQLNHRLLRIIVQTFLLIICYGLFTDVALASNAAVGVKTGPPDPLQIPRWLYVTTGGAAIGASALLASFVTDRAYIASIHRWQRLFPTSNELQSVLYYIGQIIGLGLFVLILTAGFVGPQISTINFAILVTFTGVRAGLTILTYTTGNWWRILNPWRTISIHLPNGFIEYPDRFDTWPAVIGILALVWAETTTNITTRPSTLATALGIYSLITLAGAVLFSPSVWFERADPVSVFFRMYSYVAPIHWNEQEELVIELPGTRLIQDEIVESWADVAFIIALIWELTFSGFVTTTVGATVIRAVVNRGLPPLLVYFILYLGGYVLFFGAYRYAAIWSRRTVPTYLSEWTLAARFTPPLLAIAAGYHLAHYFGFFISVSPSLFGVLTNPFVGIVNPVVLTLPAWFSGLNIAFVLVGHIVAVWLAHSTAYEIFYKRMYAIRSQYPFILVMVSYTAVSLWLISLTTGQPAYL